MIIVTYHRGIRGGNVSITSIYSILFLILKRKESNFSCLWQDPVDPEGLVLKVLPEPVGELLAAPADLVAEPLVLARDQVRVVTDAAVRDLRVQR